MSKSSKIQFIASQPQPGLLAGDSGIPIIICEDQYNESPGSPPQQSKKSYPRLSPSRHDKHRLSLPPKFLTKGLSFPNSLDSNGDKPLLPTPSSSAPTSSITLAMKGETITSNPLFLLSSLSPPSPRRLPKKKKQQQQPQITNLDFLAPLSESPSSSSSALTLPSSPPLSLSSVSPPTSPTRSSDRSPSLPSSSPASYLLSKRSQSFSHSLSITSVWSHNGASVKLPPSSEAEIQKGESETIEREKEEPESQIRIVGNAPNNSNKRQEDELVEQLCRWFLGFPRPMIQALMKRFDNDHQQVIDYLENRGWKRCLSANGSHQDDIHLLTKYYHGHFGPDLLDLIDNSTPGTFLTCFASYPISKLNSTGYFLIYRDQKEARYFPLFDVSPQISSFHAQSLCLKRELLRLTSRITCSACKTGAPCHRASLYSSATVSSLPSTASQLTVSPSPSTTGFINWIASHGDSPSFSSTSLSSKNHRNQLSSTLVYIPPSSSSYASSSPSFSLIPLPSS